MALSHWVSLPWGFHPGDNCWACCFGSMVPNSGAGISGAGVQIGFVADKGFGDGNGSGKTWAAEPAFPTLRIAWRSQGGMQGGKGFMMAKSEHGFQAQKVGLARRRGWQRM